MRNTWVQGQRLFKNSINKQCTESRSLSRDSSSVHAVTRPLILVHSCSRWQRRGLQILHRVQLLMWCDDWLQTVHGDAAVQQFLIGRRRPSSQLPIDPPTDREFIEPTLIRDEQVDKLRHDNKALWTHRNLTSYYLYTNLSLKTETLLFLILSRLLVSQGRPTSLAGSTLNTIDLACLLAWLSGSWPYACHPSTLCRLSAYE